MPTPGWLRRVDLPVDAAGRSYIDPPNLDQILDQFVNWRADVNAGGHNLTNVNLPSINSIHVGTDPHVDISGLGIEIVHAGAAGHIDFKQNAASDYDARIQEEAFGGLAFFVGGSPTPTLRLHPQLYSMLQSGIFNPSLHPTIFGGWAAQVLNYHDDVNQGGLVVANTWALNSSIIFQVGSMNLGAFPSGFKPFFEVHGAGQVYVSALPTSPSGLGPGGIWIDTASFAGKRVLSII